MIQKLKAYPIYQDSGVEWLGKVPERWKTPALRYLVRTRSGEAPPYGTGADAKFPIVGANGFIGYSPKFNLSEERILVGRVGSAGSVHRYKFPCWVTDNVLIVEKTSSQIGYEYLEQVLKVRDLASLASQSSQPLITGSLVRDQKIPLPPLLEQRAIVKFTDWADRRIRLIIAARKRRIQLLEEYRRTLINDAVTGKFDVRTGKPYPAYKDSGVEWLGNVPEGWEVKKLRQVTQLIVSNVDKKSSSSEIPVLLCNYMDVYNHEVITEDLSFMQATATKEEIRKFAVKGGDVAITKDSEIWNDIGVPAYIAYEAPDLIYGYHLAILRPSSNILQGKYLFRILQSQPVATQLHIEATGVTRFGLAQQAIKSVQIPLPTLPEQCAIAEYLDRETNKIDAAIEKTKKSIELWQELRATLIADVVTGKLDVREVAEGLPEEEPELTSKIEAFEASLQANEAGVDEGAAEGKAATLEETA